MKLYVLTDRNRIPPGQFFDAIEEALVGGAEMIQYRDKDVDGDERLRTGKRLVALCKAYGVPLIVNDYPELAAAIRADGVHLGRNDGSINDARAVLGKKAIVGVSCYDDFSLAEKSQKWGADYVAFGACFPSTTKPGAMHVPLDVIQRAHEQLNIPVCCIGGINAENMRVLLESGADMIAVCDAVFGGSDIRSRTRVLRAAISDFVQPGSVPQ